jgi:prephenate dehydrogenase
MSEQVNSLAIVGPGLIGTSIAMAAKRRWPHAVVRTIDRGQSVDAIGDASVVVLSTPVDVILDSIPSLSRVVQPHALIMDTGSTKHAIMRAARRAGLQQFVGGHPMAGGTSLAEARADLFDGKPWFLCNPDARDALTRGAKFVEALGGIPVPLADHGEQHDRLMAAISHLPQLTASVLMTVVARSIGTDNLQWAGPGLRDTTRLAASQAGVWESIIASNSQELKPLLKFLASELASIADRLDDRDSVRLLFEQANRAKSFCK